MSKPEIEVVFADPFQREMKRLATIYRHIREDVTELVVQLEAGETPGDQLQNVTPYVVYKARVKNSDAKRGKSGGYRVIYYVRTAEAVYMVYIYSKSDQSDIQDTRVRQMLEEIEQEAKQDDTPDE